jgi:hypothetical protein
MLKIMKLKLTTKTTKMKKIILSVVAVLAFGFTNAQDKKEVKNSHAVKFGIKAGANYDWLATGDNSVYDLRPEVGYHAGLLAEFRLSDRFSIQPEAMYSLHKIDLNGGNGNASNNVEITKIAVPVLGKYYFTKGLSLEVGPQVSYVIKAKNVDFDVDFKDDLRAYDIAAVSGLAYDFNMGLFIQARYFYNFLDLGNDFKGNNHYGLQASLGYKF